MAEGGVHRLRQEWHDLLVRLKTTVEGLLATPCSNVWTTYGGLDRIAGDIDKILCHRLKVKEGNYGSSLSYWNFAKGLCWLNPVMAPSKDHLTRHGHADIVESGRNWLRDSLSNHSLSSQLLTLVSSRQHLLHHYNDEAYLCQVEYFHALVLCLHAVEQNRAEVLADINPILLTRKRARKKASHSRSASLPVNHLSDPAMIRRASTDPLAPSPVSSRMPEDAGQVMVTDVTASPESTESRTEPTESSAKEALLEVLNKTGDMMDDGDYNFYDIYVQHDPLMNTEIITADTDLVKPRKSASHLGICQMLEPERKGPALTSRLNMGEMSEKVRKSEELLDLILNTEQAEEAGMLDCTAENDDASSGGDSRAGSSKKIKSDGGAAMESVPSNGVMDISHAEESRRTEPVEPSKPRWQSHYRSVSDMGLTSHTYDAPLPSGAPRVPLSQPTSPREPTSSSIHNTTSVRTSHSRQSAGTLPAGSGCPVFFPQPEKGQSLLSFLSSQDFHTCAELDKENAHFSISEALIAAIEQMKWNQVLRPQQEDITEHTEGDSDEEIQQLKQRIRIRRRERLKEKAHGFPAFSDNKTDASTTTTTTSGSPCSTSPSTSHSMSESSTESGDIDDSEILDIDDRESTDSNLTSLQESGLSLSLASLYSEEEIRKNNTKMHKVLERQGSLTEVMVNPALLNQPFSSAESVAISLIKKFSEKHLPKASDLDWLVSEQDAPQALLPLPDSFPVSPDEGENADLLCGIRTRLRGNLEWAPPRAQIIFNIHPPPKRKVVLAKQNYRCAGCGAKVEPGYMKRYRYCEYLGKYFCPRCHGNDMFFIPGRILRKWDFTKYHVSNFARDLLYHILGDPLFNLHDINLSLYRKVKQLEQIRECREQLQHIVPFLKTCRFAQLKYNALCERPAHWVNEVHIYSLAELLKVRKGEMMPQIKNLVDEALGHIHKCALCKAKGFICEICRDADDIFFPFELSRIVQCKACNACFHRSCFIMDRCPKCARIEARRLMLTAELSKSDSDDESQQRSEAHR